MKLVGSVPFLILLVFLLVWILVPKIQYHRSKSRAPPPPSGPTSFSGHSEDNSFDVDTEGACLTFDQRYSRCRDLRSKKSQSDLSSFFLQRFLQQSTSFQRDREVALLRIHKKAWPEEFWLSVCSFVLEAPGIDRVSRAAARDVFLYVLDSHEDSVPAEFRPFVRVHLDSELERVFPPPPYATGPHMGYRGYTRGGDLGGALFLKQNPQYSFVWTIESDMRFVGSWNNLFRNSRRAGKSLPNQLPSLSPSAAKADAGRVDADFIFWAPPLYFYGYTSTADALAISGANYNTTRWQERYFAFEKKAFDAVRRKRSPPNMHTMSRQRLLREVGAFPGMSLPFWFHGSWKQRLHNKLWMSAFAPAFGASARLLRFLYNESLGGNTHSNQEVNLPVAAQLSPDKMKIVSLAGEREFPTQVYFTHGRKISKKLADGSVAERAEDAPVYEEWQSGEAITEKAARFLYGLQLEQFEDKNCLAGVLVHPVKN